MKWIKAHLSSFDKAQTLGYSEDEWQGNRRADQLAQQGAALHPCSPEVAQENKDKLRLVAAIQCHMLNTWTSLQQTPEHLEHMYHRSVYKKQPPIFGGAPRGRRCAEMPAASNPNIDPKLNHCFSCFGNFEACSACGKWGSLSASPHAKRTRWAKKCLPTRRFLKALNNGHRPALASKPTAGMGAWRCADCGQRSTHLQKFRRTQGKGWLQFTCTHQPKLDDKAGRPDGGHAAEGSAEVATGPKRRWAQEIPAERACVGPLERAWSRARLILGPADPNCLASGACADERTGRPLPDETQPSFGEALAGAGGRLQADHRDDAALDDPNLADWPASARLEARPKRRQVAERTQKRPRLAQA